MTKKKRNEDTAVSGIIPFSKMPGVTSFSSLWSIKHALGTSKVGHTGTLDSFAEGLLVTLAGNLTHLVPHITSFTKTYEAVVCFGKTTDTLDPCGKITSCGNAPSREALEKILPSFTGALLQAPPAFSALHVDGKRASDLARNGQAVNLEKREIFIYQNQLLDFKEKGSVACESDASFALLRVTCSKGTYIRSLARDLGEALGTGAYLLALRRTQVGPFLLEDAALAERLPSFTIEYGIKNADFMQSLSGGFAKDRRDDENAFSSIRSHLLSMTPELSLSCGLESVFLKNKFESSYNNGRPLNYGMFVPCKSFSEENVLWKKDDELSVFYEDSTFAGMIVKGEKYPRYGFVVRHEKKDLLVLDWESVLKGNFPLQWKKQGVALSIGSFDGVHAGHRKLLSSVVEGSEEKHLVPGLVTFRSPAKLPGMSFPGSVDTLPMRCKIAGQMGLSFVIVIDFSPEFSKMEGTVFIRKLCSLLGLSLLVEGEDFKCGYKGSLSMKELPSLAESEGFSLVTVPDVTVSGIRVSSSSVRQSVMEGNMALAKEMLLRPFSLDLSCMEWTLCKKTEEDELWFWADTEKGDFSQVLPKNGQYEVQVTLSGSGASEDSVELKEVSCSVIRSLCRVEGKKLYLLLPTQGMSLRIRTLNFI